MSVQKRVNKEYHEQETWEDRHTILPNVPLALEVQYSEWENEISFTLTLDLDRRPRMNQQGTKEIEVHFMKHAREDARTKTLCTAYLWG